VHLRRVVFVETVASILGKLFDGVVVCEDIAMNATHERNGNFQDRNEEMIRGFANWTGAHRGHHGNTARTSESVELCTWGDLDPDLIATTFIFFH
jgi:hypothetical protein